MSDLLSHLSEDEIRELARIGRVNLGWWNLAYANDSALLFAEYADGFYRVANEQLTLFCEKRVYSDSDALPVLFLVFHYIELSLKSSIAARIRILDVLGKAHRDPIWNHRIEELLQFLLELYEPTEEFISSETQAFILKIANLNGRFAQVFRYPFDMRGNIHHEDNPILSIGLLKAEFEICAAELNQFRESLMAYLTR